MLFLLGMEELQVTCQALVWYKVHLSTFSYISSRKPRTRPQASSEQADAQSRPQVSREMLPIHCHVWTCLSNATLECTSPAKRFPLKTANLNSTSTTKTRTNKYTRKLRYTERTLLKLKNTKNWSTKYQRINKQLMKTKKLKYKVSKNK